MSAASSPVPRVRVGWPSSSLKNKGMSPAACSTPLLAAFPGNDDEKERRQRRRSRVVDLQSALDTSINDSASHSAAGTPAAVPKLSNAQISEHYSTCIKLSTENKITTKNAFGLHLIDYMADILKQEASEVTNFKVAAGTLDASTKIYAVRVDAVHADAYRVLGGLGAETKPEEDGEHKDAEQDDAVEVTAKQPKKKRPPKKTVEQNLSNINSAETERKCEVDPMFQRMASSFDESSTAGVFLSVLFSENSRCELLFPSHMTLLHSSQSYSPPPPQRVPASPFTGGLQRLHEKSTICPSLEDFSFSSWNPEQTIKQLAERRKEGEHVFDVNADPEPEPEEDEYQDFDADYEDGPGECDEGPKEFKDGCEASRSGKGRDVIPIGEADITTMCLQLSSQPREYSYFSPKTMATWAGPGFWQFKPKHKLDHVPEKETRKRKPKKSFEIDFNDDVSFENFFRTTRAATTNSKSALSSSNKKTTLPSDFQFPPETLSQLSLKPSSSLCPEEQKRLSGELGEGIGDYDYNNPNDTANFCPGLQGGDSDEDVEGFTGSDDTPGDGIPLPSQDEDVSTYGGEDLVPEPHRVNKIEINYAKTAKKMDMKRLKNNMWTLLTESPEKPTQEAETPESSEVAGEKVFSQTTNALLQRLPSTMAQNLSVPLAFIALLHLANEKNLELVKVDDMSDIIIRQGH
ncbi:condensin complex subunit 2 isoform X2 [Synchiropus splendidus]|uniref:condensin complex subunit 2 isoform X2 n=1 Tax=Synchiropus splendidus TaxID=270530 RepID=UPI00237DEB73|nr:condensin complex subunit 2 isoform X2 [Synchiropus splendidus]